MKNSTYTSANRDLSNIREAWKAPLTAEINARKRAKVLEAFPALTSCSHDAYLAIEKYLTGIPESFYCREAFKLFSLLLEKQLKCDELRLVEVLNENVADIDRALLALNKVGYEDWHDSEIEQEEFTFMLTCDQQLHPAYLKLAEGVLHKLIKPLATCLRMERNKSISDLWKLSAVIEEMNNASCSLLVNNCDGIVRNSIAHGTITYMQREVIYYDQKGNSKKFEDVEVVKMVDGLVDVCHGCALALKLFYRQNISGHFKMPRQVMIEELQADTKTPWWHIKGCLVSELAGKSQLVIYAQPRSRDCRKIQYMIVYSGILAEYFAPGFDRYIFSLNSHIASPGFAALNGLKLKAIRERRGKRIMEDYKDIIENNLILYAPNINQPRIISILETLLTSTRLHMPVALAEMRNNLSMISVVARHAKMHRRRWRVVMDGSVVVDISKAKDPKMAVRNARRRIINAARKYAGQHDRWSKMLRLLPIGYARIAVFNNNRRHRQLYGLTPDLVCTVQVKFISEINRPDIKGSTIESIWPYRIAWNQAWLETLPKNAT